MRWQTREPLLLLLLTVWLGVIEETVGADVCAGETPQALQRRLEHHGRHGGEQHKHIDDVQRQ
jgi:hypothetical protein